MRRKSMGRSIPLSFSLLAFFLFHYITPSTGGNYLPPTYVSYYTRLRGRRPEQKAKTKTNLNGTAQDQPKRKEKWRSRVQQIYLACEEKEKEKKKKVNSPKENKKEQDRKRCNEVGTRKWGKKKEKTPCTCIHVSYSDRIRRQTSL
ncbi:uncharacterized protein F4812DRAFT_437214 [Daldinia caldariorum]|uniref:uncharacterized protein n=1 Tax=Daldinia caldariorum TaxID=326644 RepID=UPI00200825E5|nr:uncharacterized protein F4812DRAFT_437214 [Daldinia caldariorum]KAI1465704.1 hypothetical protein F4812DRAFT_437214 [Daldinia caldariorum]